VTRMPLAERRQQLVDAAIAVMTREGVNKATTRAIVAEAGTSLSVFHYCFDSKQSLLEAVIKTIVGKTVSLAEATIAPGSDQLDTIRNAFMAYWSHVKAHPEEHLLTYEVTQYCLRQPEFEHVAKHQYDLYAANFLALLDAFGLRPTVSNETLARYLAVMTDGITLDWLARRDDESAMAVIDTVVAQVGTLLAPA